MLIELLRHILGQTGFNKYGLLIKECVFLVERLELSAEWMYQGGAICILFTELNSAMPGPPFEYLLVCKAIVVEIDVVFGAMFCFKGRCGC